MIVVGGHPAIDSEPAVAFVRNLDEIEKTRPNSLVVMAFAKEKMEGFKTCGVPLALIVSNLVQFVYAMNLGAKYALCSKDLAPILQKAADNYVSDTRVLALIDNEEEMEWAALEEIDGVFFANLLEK